MGFEHPAITRLRADFAARLILLCDHAGIKPSNRARAVYLQDILANHPLTENKDIGTSGIVKWLDGTSLPELPRLIVLSQHFKRPIDWMLRQQGEARDDKPRTVVPIDGATPDAALEVDTELLTQYGLPATLRALRVAADYMEPFVTVGDYVFYDAGRRELDELHSIYVLQDCVGRTYIRRLQYRTMSVVRLLCDNTRFPYEDIPRDRLRSSCEDCASPAANCVTINGPVLARLLIGR